MSGICGVYRTEEKARPELIGRMLAADALPADAVREQLAAPGVMLGVCRAWDFQCLASQGPILVAADADLYHLDELRAGLKQQGAAVEGLSVAGLIATAYRLHGLDFLNSLHGAFAVALWDGTNQRLVLAIDRLGIKGLYWSQRPETLAFGTRMASVVEASGLAPELSEAAIANYLVYSVIPAPMTIYRGVEKMRPGHAIVYERGKIEDRRYWDLGYPEQSGISEKEWAGQTREEIRAAVHRNLEGCSARSTGAFLSGGTDSSSVVAFMSEHFAPVNTFSIYFEDPRYSEIEYARTTVRRFAAQHHERCLQAPDISAVVEKIIDAFDEPFANSSSLGGYYCALLAREAGVDVMLGGDGGDELFGGNERYATDKQFAIYQELPRWVRTVFIESWAKRLPAEGGRLSLPRKYIHRANIPNPRRMLSYAFFVQNDPREIFAGDFLRATDPATWLDIAQAHYDSAQATSNLNRLLYLDVKMTLADNDIRKVSTTAELAGVRVRYPFLDDSLAEFSGRIPTNLKLKGFEKRYIFKQAMKGILPDKVLYKHKHGFGVPVSRWFLSDPRLSALVKDVLFDSRTAQRGIFQKDFVQRLMEMHSSGHAGYFGEIIWYLLTMELWLRRHFDHQREVAHGFVAR